MPPMGPGGPCHLEAGRAATTARAHAPRRPLRAHVALRPLRAHVSLCTGRPLRGLHAPDLRKDLF